MVNAPKKSITKEKFKGAMHPAPVDIQLYLHLRLP